MTHTAANRFQGRLRALIIEFQGGPLLISPVEIVGNMECIKQEVILAAQGIEISDDEEDDCAPGF